MDSSTNEEYVDDVTEAEIESNFASYRPYIESCVKTMDMLVFFKLFSTDQVKTIYRKSKSDPVESTRMTFDTIVNMRNTTPQTFHHLLHALQEAGYPKLVNLLKGLLIRVHDSHRKKLKSFAKDIYNRLNVCDVLPYLITKAVLNQHDTDEIMSIERTESRGSAVLYLLSILPNRNKDWFEHFLWSLLESKQKDLAIIIDEGTTISIQSAAALGIVSPVASSSLQVSIKGLKKQLANKTSLTDSERQQTEFIRNLESVKFPTSTKSTNEQSFNLKDSFELTDHLSSILEHQKIEAVKPKEKSEEEKARKAAILAAYSAVDSGGEDEDSDDAGGATGGKGDDYSERQQTEFIRNLESVKFSPTTKSTKEQSFTLQESSEKSSIVESNITREFGPDTATFINKDEYKKCNPCEKKNCHSEAIYFCQECLEYLCDSCEDFHGRLKITQVHKISKLHPKRNGLQGETCDITLCECRHYRKVEKYCQNHEDVFCSNCSQSDHKNCQMKLITEISDSDSNKKEISVVDRSNSLLEKMRNIGAEKDKSERNLQRSLKSCQMNIMDFAEELHNHVSRLTNKALDEVQTNKNMQTSCIDSYIKTCKMFQQSLGAKMATFSKIQQGQDRNDSERFVACIKLSRHLTEAEHAIRNLEEIKGFNLTFDRNPCLEYMIGRYPIGVIRLAGAISNEENGACRSHQRNVRGVNFEDEKLSESWATVSYFGHQHHNSVQKSAETFKEWEIVEDN